jgi:hypothetical protein
MIEPTLRVRMAAFDYHATADDTPEEPFEGFGALADARLDRRRGVHVAECDLQRQTHIASP